MSESVKTLSLGRSQGESPANKGLRIGRERVMIPESLDAKARGASASVQIAILLPPNEEHPGHSSTQGHFVALKQFRLDDDKGDKAGLAPLAHELSLLRKLEHKNIVRGLGFVENVAQGIAWIVIPWAVNGHLRDFVRSRLSSWARRPLGIWSGIKDRFALIEDIMRGLEYLHGQSEPICHGDLKSLNILVDEQQNAVITDFGSARTLEKPEGWEAPSGTAEPSCSTTSQPPEGPRVEFLESTGSITMTAPGYTDYWSRTREYIERDLKAVDEAVLLQAVSERHLSEGRLGEALQYIQAFRRAVRLTEGEPAAITFQDMLDRCRRSPSTVDTVPEEEAARSWNSALDLFAGQLYLEAERHIIDAALLYKVLGFDTQVLECVQFLDMLQAATATPSQNPTEEARYNQDLPKRLLMRSEELKDPKYENRENPAEMVWFVA
ncbi:hypothetical protein FRC05_006785 [Tulasnella sp. 425]|nr:hypothetical protein FRC05_006785 [Tulasnella sp. 425]